MKPTIKTIADELGISISTVSRALKNNPRIGLKTREKVLQLAQELDYTPNPLALHLQQNRTRTIGLIVPKLSEDFFAKIIHEVEDIALKNNYQILLRTSNNCMEREKQIIASMIRLRVDGILISLASSTTDYHHFINLQRKNIPIVFFDRIPRNFPSHKIRNPVCTAAETAVRYLFKKGYRRIALLNGPSNLAVSNDRLDGYLKAIKQLGLKTSQSFIKSTDLTLNDTIQKMEELILLKNDGPEAILAFNDYTYVYAMKACRKHNVNHLAFVSFGKSDLLEHCEPRPMAYFDMNPILTGKKAIELMLQLLEEPMQYQEIMVDTQLVEYS